MTEKWAQQSHKAFPPCLAQRVQYADDRVQFCIIAALDRHDVSCRTGMTEMYLSKVADFATFKIYGKQICGEARFLQCMSAKNDKKNKK